MRHCSLCIWLQIVTRILGPEPGYVATPIFLAAAALTLLADRPKLPSGGVFTAGVLFKDTSYISRLKSLGIQFEKLQEGPVTKF
jgi:short subunit dehydrogenase-like uncharacterized protein